MAEGRDKELLFEISRNNGERKTKCCVMYLLRCDVVLGVSSPVQVVFATGQETRSCLDVFCIRSSNAFLVMYVASTVSSLQVDRQTDRQHSV